MLWVSKIGNAQDVAEAKLHTEVVLLDVTGVLLDHQHQYRAATQSNLLRFHI